MHFACLTRKGHVPAQALSVVYGSVQVSVNFITNVAFLAQTYQLHNYIQNNGIFLLDKYLLKFTCLMGKQVILQQNH